MGPFIGGRRLQLRVDQFEPEQVLRVAVRHLRGDRGLIAFQGRIEDGELGEPLVEGRLHVYSTDAWTERMPEIGSAREAT